MLEAIAGDKTDTIEQQARFQLGYSQWQTRKGEWVKWQKDQPRDEVPKRGPWTLVARTERHPSFAEQYASLPSHLPGWRRSEKQRPPRWCIGKNLDPVMVGLDCEMCETDVDQRALVGVSVVGVDGTVLLKTLVKPPGKIVDLKPDITGLKMKDFKGVKTTLKDVQDKLAALCTPNTVLVGHGLVHDLKALKFDHAPVIDTAFLFSYKNLPRSTPGLADLCKRLLSSEMRKGDGTHDSVEDAKMALELAKWECLNDKPTTPMDPPTDKVDPRDLTKLFIHRLPRGVLLSDLRGLFDKQRGAIGVDHLGDIVALHGKFLGPETALDLKRTTSVYVEFTSVDKANAAFTSLRGGKGTDALGRPQKAVRMLEGEVQVVGSKPKNAATPNFSKMTVTEMRLALEQRQLPTNGLKPELVERLTAAMAGDVDSDSEGGGDSDSGSDSDDDDDDGDKEPGTEEKFAALTVPKLKEALETRGLDTAGAKGDLVKRLETAAAKKSAKGGNEKAGETEKNVQSSKTRVVMVRKMAAHGGRAIGASDKHNEPAGKGEELKGALKRKLEGGDEKEKKDEKKPRRVPRPSRNARLAAKGIGK